MKGSFSTNAAHKKLERCTVQKTVSWLHPMKKAHWKAQFFSNDNMKNDVDMLQALINFLYF